MNQLSKIVVIFSSLFYSAYCIPFTFQMGPGIGLGVTTPVVSYDTIEFQGSKGWMSSFNFDAMFGITVSKWASVYIANKTDFMCPYASIIAMNTTGPLSVVRLSKWNLQLFLSGGYSLWFYPLNSTLNGRYFSTGYYVSAGASKMLSTKRSLSVEYCYSDNKFTEPIGTLNYTQSLHTNVIRVFINFHWQGGK